MKTVHDRAVGHITVAELELKLGDTLVGVWQSIGPAFLVGDAYTVLSVSRCALINVMEVISTNHSQ
jgi:hypothetical protein